VGVFFLKHGVQIQQYIHKLKMSLNAATNCHRNKQWM